MSQSSAQLILSTLLILFRAECAFAEGLGTIDDIQLKAVNSNSTNEGAVLIKSKDEWYGVCHYGEHEYGNTWDVNEASAACMQLQLGFKGGWPTDMANVHLNAFKGAHRFIVNFDCSWREIHLKNCMREAQVTTSCKQSLLAGVHCYRDFRVHLAGGAAPNAGRVEVKYDTIWASVCYGTELNTSKLWKFDNAEVVCRELGFPGTMFARQGGQGQGRHKETIYGYGCKPNLILKYESLHECLQDPPKEVLPDTYNEPSCGEDNEAVVICAVPGYTGCFQTESNTEKTSHVLRLEVNNMTIGMCRHYCRAIDQRFACLYNGMKCLCRDSVTGHTRVEDFKCETQCSGEDLEACGGPKAMSVYNANVGICDDPLNGTDIYYYGDIFSNFSCTNGQQLEGAKSIQCVMNASDGTMQWSEDFPECKGRHWGIYKLAILVISSVFIFSIFIAAAIMVACRKRKQHGGGGQEPTTDPFYDVIQYDTCDLRPRESSECGGRVDGFTKEERATCNASKEICQVCRNSYTEFRIDAEANGAACSSHYSDTYDEGWVQNSAYETSGSFHTSSG